MNNDKRIGVDLGGTNVRAGLVFHGEILKLSQNIIPKETTEPKDVLAVIFNVIDEVFEEGVISIGIGVPGLVDVKNQTIHNISNIEQFSTVPLGKLLNERYHVPIEIDNDANCFVMGENVFGKGQSVDNMVGITIGTGLGGGIVSDGKLISCAHRGAGEFGEMPYLDANVEAYASGKYFKNQYGIDGEKVLVMAKAGDEKGLLIFKQFGYHLAQALKFVLFAVDPEMIIIGGSVALSREFFHDAMMEELKTFPFEELVRDIKIEYASVDNVALLGAAMLFSNMEGA